MQNEHRPRYAVGSIVRPFIHSMVLEIVVAIVIVGVVVSKRLPVHDPDQ